MTGILIGLLVTLLLVLLMGWLGCCESAGWADEAAGYK